MATGHRRLADPIPRSNLLVLIAISCLAHALLVLMLVACWFFFLLPAPDVSFYPRDRNTALTMILLVLAVRAPGFWIEYRRTSRFIAARGIIIETFRATIGCSVLSSLLLATAHPRPPLLVVVATIVLAVSLTCAGLSALLALLRPHYARELAEKRAGILHCHKCNYDLRASTDRCPECGTPIRT